MCVHERLNCMCGRAPYTVTMYPKVIREMLYRNKLFFTKDLLRLLVISTLIHWTLNWCTVSNAHDVNGDYTVNVLPHVLNGNYATLCILREHFHWHFFSRCNQSVCILCFTDALWFLSLLSFSFCCIMPYFSLLWFTCSLFPSPPTLTPLELLWVMSWRHEGDQLCLHGHPACCGHIVTRSEAWPSHCTVGLAYDLPPHCL